MYGNIICIYLELLRYNIITAVTNYLAKTTPIPNHVLSLFASLCLLENDIISNMRRRYVVRYVLYLAYRSVLVQSTV